MFGTIYDISTVAILWFAGASAMSGLLNLVPRYLPRFGMAPRWAEAVRALVIHFTVINLFVTWIFGASVVAQGGAYATGVMVLMSSAAVAVVIDHVAQARAAAGGSGCIGAIVAATAVFFYTTVAIIIEKPDGIKIAGAFIAVGAGVLDHLAHAAEHGAAVREVRLRRRDVAVPVGRAAAPGVSGARAASARASHDRARRTKRFAASIGSGRNVPIVFVEATVGDPSEFHHNPMIEVTEEDERFMLRLTRCVSVAHAVATVALELSKTGKPPEIHFGWSGESPLAANLGFLLFGEGNVPWLVRELILKAEPDPAKQPRVIIG